MNAELLQIYRQTEECRPSEQQYSARQDQIFKYEQFHFNMYT